MFKSNIKMSSSLEETRVQFLQENEFNEGKLYRLKVGWILRLKLSTNLIHENVKVFSNLPKDKEKEFNRNTFYEYEWQSLKNSLPHDDFNKYVSLECKHPGSFSYYFTINNNDTKKGGSNFLVDPRLILMNEKIINLNSLQIQTVLSKQLGSLNEWKSRLEVSKNTGYNMFHFTPCQVLSTESNSSYCIRNHLELIEQANSSKEFNLNDLSTLIDTIYKEWNMFSICDLVFNHMANDAEFLESNPNATYNMKNSSHLIPAFVLDRILYHFTVGIMNGEYESQGISKNKLNDYNLETIRHIIRHQEIPKYKLEEFYQIDLNKILMQIKEIGLVELETIEKNLEEFKNKTKNYNQRDIEWNKLEIIQNASYKRLESTVDFEIIQSILKSELEHLNLNLDLNSNENSQLIVNVYEKFYFVLNKKNEEIKNRIYDFMNEAVNNVILNIQYHFFAHHGPKWECVDLKHPIAFTYFYFPFESENAKNDEFYAFDSFKSLKIQAHNGWVMNDDPLKNFASQDSLVYIKRHLIPWGDSVKLRFGNQPEDNPELWKYMEDYTVKTAQIFHGVRLDNCHSTPLHVAKYFLDKARSVRPNLYVIAELFTNSVNVDNKFVTELGINSLIREAMGAWNSNELGRLVHRYGGEPVGSFYQDTYRPLTDCVAHAIFYDLTHDNESLIKSHSVYDALSTSSLVAMSSCAIGSTRGFDELVPHHINVVTETRVYSAWSNEINFKNGILRAKSIMNKLHFDLDQNNFNQLYVDQFDADTVVVTRHNPRTHQSYILVARTSFSTPNEFTCKNLEKSLNIPSRVDSILVEANLKQIEDLPEFLQSNQFINGLTNYQLELNENTQVNQSRFIGDISYNGSETNIHFKYFPPGAILVFKVVLNESSLSILPYLQGALADLSDSTIQCETSVDNSEIENILSSLTYDELNILLFRCSQEESNEGINSDIYVIPNYGPLIYCGLRGFMNILDKQRLSNNLGHPMFENLRQGDWMMNYTIERLKKYSELRVKERSGLLSLSLWLSRVFEALSKMPRYLIPAYFDLIITTLYTKSLEKCLNLMSFPKNENLKDFQIINGSSFLRSLALGSFLFSGHIRSALLPNTVVELDQSQLMLSLSAGLPHFSVSYMRNWGRDTFISLRGLLLLTNRFNDARNLILSFGSCLRHGLIPNLLCEGKSARYNCRDAVWWWLKAIKDYTELDPNGMDILNSEIYRLYPEDESGYPSEDELVHKPIGFNRQKLYDVIQEALTVHVNGLSFRERNAGREIDEHMLLEGFNNEIGIDLETGFIFGGNTFNCGTWMDKLGSSHKAGNHGLPATPRDGSAVELIGLSRCVLDWLINANKTLNYPYDSVILGSNPDSRYSFVEWAQKIDDNFEKYFWISPNSTESKHINKRNIYKDTLNSSIHYSDYQLRPNFLIALTLSPQMFNKENAKKAIEQCRLHLLNEPDSIGIKTLDSSDFNYCGNYDNANDSNDTKIAHGFNYHQGPEWLWPVGYYLRAYLYYFKDSLDERAEVISLVKKHLGKLYEKINASDWKMLPELTNRNGEECYFSCAAQAWSMATIIEVLYDLSLYG